MAGTPLLDGVESYTRLAGHNRVAMLLFRLGDFYETFEDDAHLAAAKFP